MLYPCKPVWTMEGVEWERSLPGCIITHSDSYYLTLIKMYLDTFKL